MHEQLAQRLQELKAEFESGQQMLAELEAKKENMEQTLLRISGAIQVLEEELARYEDLAAEPEKDEADAVEADSQEK